MDWGLKRYRTVAKTTHIIAIMANVLSPSPLAAFGPGSPGSPS